MPEFFERFAVPPLAPNTTWVSPVIDTLTTPGAFRIVARFTAGSTGNTGRIDESDDGTTWWPQVAGHGQQAVNTFASGPLLAGFASARFVRIFFRSGSDPTPECFCVVAGTRI